VDGKWRRCIIKLTPQINEGGAAVMLKIDLESSSMIPKVRTARRGWPPALQAHGQYASSQQRRRHRDARRIDGPSDDSKQDRDASAVRYRQTRDTVYRKGSGAR